MTKAEIIEMISNEEKPIVNDLMSIGISVDSVWDLVNNLQHPHLKNKFIGHYEIA